MDHRLLCCLFAIFFFLACLFVVSYCVAQAGLEFEILLSQPPEPWKYRCASPQPAQYCRF